MKLRPNKKGVLSFFMYYGWLILAFGLVSFAALTLVLSSINKIYDHQRFSVFFAAYGIKEERYKDELGELLKDDGVIQVNYYSFFADDTELVTYYEMYGVKSDVIIFSEKDVTDMQEYIGDYFISITDPLKEELGISNNYSYYNYGENAYAIKIFDKNDASYNEKFTYSEWINFKSSDNYIENFYILLKKSSVNYGEYGEKNKSTNAIKGLRYILNESEK